MCWKCGNNVEIETISRNSECPTCHADLHSCRNCEYYSPGSHYDCHETVQEIVTDKERANFCDSFKVKRQWSASAVKDDKADKARKAFDSLFG